MAEPRADFIVGLKATADTQGFQETDAAQKRSKDTIVDAQKEIVDVTERATKAIEDQTEATKKAAVEAERSAQIIDAARPGPSISAEQFDSDRNASRDAAGLNRGGTSGLAAEAELRVLHEQLTVKQQLTAEEREAADAAARKLAIESQKAVIIETQDEANAAALAGETAKAAVLTREVAIETEILRLQRSGVVMEEQLREMAERTVQAKERQIAEEMRITAEKKRQAAEERAAAQAAQAEHAHGEMGMFSGLRNFGLSQSTAVAGGAGAMVGGMAANLIREATQQMEQQLQVTHQLSEEFSKQVQEWSAMAQGARSQTDLLRLHESITNSIAAAQEKVNTVQERGRGTLKDWADDLKSIFNKAADDKNIDAHLNTNADNEREEQQKREQALVVTARNEERQAREHAAKMTDIARSGLDEQIAAYGEQINRQKAVRDANDKANTVEARKNVEDASRQIEELTKLQEAAAQKKAKLIEDANKADQEVNGGKRHDDRADAGEKIEQLKGQIGELGVMAQTPAEAMEQINKSTDEAAKSAAPLVAQWQKLVEKAEDLAQKEGKALNENMVREAKEFKEREAQQKREGQAIEDNMAKVAEEGRRQVEKQAREGKALDENMAKLSEQAKKQMEMDAEWKQGNEVLRAQISGNQALTKELEIQAQYLKDKARFIAGGKTDSEAASMAQVTKELREQVALKERESKLNELRDQDEIEAAKNTRSKTDDRDAAVTAARRKREKEYRDAGASPEEARKAGDDAGATLDKQLRHRDHVIGGTTQSEADQQGSGLDDLRRHMGDGPLKPKKPVLPKIPIQPPGNTGDNSNTAAVPETPATGAGSSAAGEKAAAATEALATVTDALYARIESSAKATAATMTKAVTALAELQANMESADSDLQSQIDSLPTS